MAPIFSSKALVAILLLGSAYAAPLNRRQLHGEGVALDALLTDTDNGVGYGTENAEDNAASLITSAKGGAPSKRQLHGEGVAADALLTDTDNGVGYGTENAEDNAASLITSVKGGAPAAPARRQLDKVVNGLANVGNAAGVSAVTDPVQSSGDSIDGSLTDGAANAGTDAGAMEESTLEAAGNAVPTHLTRRQLDKIANGAGNVLDAAGANDAAGVVVPEADAVDGQSTDDAANIGTQVGGDEETVLEQAGSDVPSHTKH